MQSLAAKCAAPILGTEAPADWCAGRIPPMSKKSLTEEWRARRAVAFFVISMGCRDPLEHKIRFQLEGVFEEVRVELTLSAAPAPIELVR